MLLDMTNVTLVLRFMKSNKFYYTQTAKLQIQKILIVKGSDFVHGDEFSPIFRILIFPL